MTPIILIDKLIEFLTPVVAEFDLQSNVETVRKAPQVLAGYLPAKLPLQTIPDFPYVLVRYIEDTDAEDADTAIVKIYVGSYSEDAQDGWRDAMNILTKTKTALMRKRFFGPFKIERPIKTELPEEQPFPEWIAILTLNVTMPHVIEEGDCLDDF